MSHADDAHLADDASLSDPWSLQLLSWGAVGVVFVVSDRIVAKQARTLANKGMKHEHHIFDELERKPLCPHIIRSFLRLPDINFLENMTGGNLEARLRSYQIREGHEFVSVRSPVPANLVSRWMAELAGGVAWLEKLGLAHGDIRPSNLLLNSTDHLKLADFDCAAELGQQELEAGAPPYARLQGSEAGDQKGTFGLLGPRTETFAIGSVFYYLTRGCEPYEDTPGLGSEVVYLLQNKQFPPTDPDDARDAVISKCWHGDFASVQQLAIDVDSLSLDDEREDSSGDSCEDRRQECVEWYKTWAPSIEAWMANYRAQLPSDEE